VARLVFYWDAPDFRPDNPVFFISGIRLHILLDLPDILKDTENSRIAGQIEETTINL
jgi:hypothetical protein